MPAHIAIWIKDVLNIKSSGARERQLLLVINPLYFLNQNG